MQNFACQNATNPLAILSQMAWPHIWKAITRGREMEMCEIMWARANFNLPIMVQLLIGKMHLATKEGDNLKKLKYWVKAKFSSLEKQY